MGRIQHYLAGERQARRSALQPKSPSTVFGCLAMTQSVTLRKRGRNRVCVLSFQPVDRAPPPCRRGERNRAAPCFLHLITRTTINVSRPVYALKATRLSVPLITVIPQSNLAKSHYAAASRVPLIQSPSLRVPRPVSDSQSDPAIPYCIIYQVDLPPDIHPLPESINAYVSPFACFTQSPLHRHINLRAYSCCYTTRVLPPPSSSTHTPSNPTCSTSSPTDARRSQRSPHATRPTSAHGRTRRTAGSARRCVGSHLGSSRAAHRSSL